MQPWESGIWDVIFGPSIRSSFISMPALARPAVVSYSSIGPVTAPVEKRRKFAEAPHRKLGTKLTNAASWRETSDAKMDAALKRWSDVVIHFTASFQLVAQLAELTSVAEQLRVLKDVGRLAHAMHYVGLPSAPSGTKTNSSDVCPFPQVEFNCLN